MATGPAILSDGGPRSHPRPLKEFADPKRATRGPRATRPAPRRASPRVRARRSPPQAVPVGQFPGRSSRRRPARRPGRTRRSPRKRPIGGRWLGVLVRQVIEVGRFDSAAVALKQCDSPDRRSLMTSGVDVASPPAESSAVVGDPDPDPRLLDQLIQPGGLAGLGDRGQGSLEPSQRRVGRGVPPDRGSSDPPDAQLDLRQVVEDRFAIAPRAPVEAPQGFDHSLRQPLERAPLPRRPGRSAQPGPRPS